MKVGVQRVSRRYWYATGGFQNNDYFRRMIGKSWQYFIELSSIPKHSKEKPMADNTMWLVYRPTGEAVFLGKRMYQDWYGVPDDLIEQMRLLFDRVDEAATASGGEFSQDDFAIAMEESNSPYAITKFVIANLVVTEKGTLQRLLITGNGSAVPKDDATLVDAIVMQDSETVATFIKNVILKMGGEEWCSWSGVVKCSSGRDYQITVQTTLGMTGREEIQEQRDG